MDRVYPVNNLFRLPTTDPSKQQGRGKSEKRKKEVRKKSKEEKRNQGTAGNKKRGREPNK